MVVVVVERLQIVALIEQVVPEPVARLLSPLLIAFLLPPPELQVFQKFAEESQQH
jgi:hypothetical protein